MYNRRQNSDRRESRGDRIDHQPKKRYSKSLIMLKSTVFALFVVLVVLIAAFEIIRHNRETKKLARCEDGVKIGVTQGIESFKQKDGILFVLTKAHEGKQEIIRIDSECGKELSRIKFAIN